MSTALRYYTSKAWDKTLLSLGNSHSNHITVIHGFYNFFFFFGFFWTFWNLLKITKDNNGHQNGLKLAKTA